MMTIIGKVGCPILSITYFYETYPFIFAIVFIAAGVLITFLGNTLFKVLLFILAAFAVTGILFVIIYQLILLPRKPEEIAFWVTLGICGACGLTAGFFAAKYHTVCIVLAGGSLAAIVAFVLYNAIGAAMSQVVRLSSMIHYSGYTSSLQLQQSLAVSSPNS